MPPPVANHCIAIGSEESNLAETEDKDWKAEAINIFIYLKEGASKCLNKDHEIQD